jgi:hypothetical protein
MCRRPLTIRTWQTLEICIDCVSHGAGGQLQGPVVFCASLSYASAVIHQIQYSHLSQPTTYNIAINYMYSINHAPFTIAADASPQTA